MLEKSKARLAKFEETNETFRKVKQHLDANKQTYFVGAGCLAVGFVLRRPHSVTMSSEGPAPIFNNTPVFNVSVSKAEELLATSDFLVHERFIEKLKAAGGVMDVTIPDLGITLDVSLVGG